MKRYFAVLILFLGHLQGCARTPERPGNVPSSAVKVDGAYIQCTVESALHANRCTVYGDSTGAVLASGIYVLSGSGREARSEDLNFGAFDGTQIYLVDARTLYPIQLEEFKPLEETARSLAGNNAIDCGLIRASPQLKAASQCGRKAFAEKKPFFVLYAVRKDTSVLASGIVASQTGEAYAVVYSNTKWFSGMPFEAKSNNSYVLRQSCSKPVTLWTSFDGELTCVPPQE